MSSKNTVDSYGWVAKTFHWGMFVIIVAQFYFGNNMKEMGKYHIATGFAILLLMLIRFAWRASNPVPKMPDGTGSLQTMAAHGLHILFYAVLIGMPIAGVAIVQGKGFPVSIMGWFNLPTIFEKSESGAELASTMHGVVAKVILLSVLLHIIVALYHHFGKKDNVLKRMLP